MLQIYRISIHKFQNFVEMEHLNEKYNLAILTESKICNIHQKYIASIGVARGGQWVRGPPIKIPHMIKNYDNIA